MPGMVHQRVSLPKVVFFGRLNFAGFWFQSLVLCALCHGVCPPHLKIKTFWHIKPPCQDLWPQFWSSHFVCVCVELLKRSKTCTRQGHTVSITYPVQRSYGPGWISVLGQHWRTCFRLLGLNCCPLVVLMKAVASTPDNWNHVMHDDSLDVFCFVQVCVGCSRLQQNVSSRCQASLCRFRSCRMFKTAVQCNLFTWPINLLIMSWVSAARNRSRTYIFFTSPSICACRILKAVAKPKLLYVARQPLPIGCRMLKNAVTRKIVGVQFKQRRLFARPGDRFSSLSGA